VIVGGKDYGVLRLSFAGPVIAAKIWKLVLMAFALGLGSLLAGMILIRFPLVRWLGAFSQVELYESDQSGRTLSADMLASHNMPEEFRKTFGVLQRTAANLQAQKLEALVTLRTIHDGVLTLDQKGVVLLANPAASVILGTSKLVGEKIMEVLPEVLTEKDLQHDIRSRRSQIRHADGHTLMIETSLSPITTGVSLQGQSAAPGHVFVVRDVTEADALEQKLRNQLAVRANALKTLRSALESLTQHGNSDSDSAGDDIETVSSLLSELIQAREADRHALNNQKFALDEHAIVSITDRHGLIEYANDRLCNISGYRRDELLGSPVARLYADPDSTPLKQLHELVYHGKVWKGEICNRTRDGKLFWVSATVVPLADAQGIPQQFIAIQTDISDLKSAEEALQKAKDAAEAANRAKSEFLANMSHEIRTPMNGIMGMTDLVLETQLDAQQSEYVQIVKTSAQSLLTIINDILDFSKIEAGRLDMEVLPFSLRENLQGAMDIMAYKAKDKGLALQAEVGADVPDQITGDPVRLRQIITNLVGNAIKFTAEGAITVTVSLVQARASRVKLKISVQDTGIGIPADKIDRLFKPFSQVDASTTREYGGTGLGLTISSQLAKLMQGEMGVESTPGKGSTFWFTCELGLAAQRPAASPVLSDALAATSAATEAKILLVEDNAINQKLALHLLKKLGYHTETANNGLEALRWLEKQSFDLVLMDCQMPEMDGYEATRHIRAMDSKVLNHDVPIVALTANAMKGDREKVISAGMDDYLTKPIKAADLASTISHWLQARRRTAESSEG
jgi:PAS domain S-box-containing protein